MPAEHHIRYVPESPSVDYRIVMLAAIASLVLVAGAIGMLYATYQRSVPVKDVPAPQTFSRSWRNRRPDTRTLPRPP